MKIAMCMAVAVAMFAVVPIAGLAQQMPQQDRMMMHGTTVEGVVTQVRFAACGSAQESCQGIFQMIPASEEAMMMHQPAMAGDHMMAEHPVTVIVTPGTTLTWQGAVLPLTRLKPGDHVKLEYQTVDGMNIALGLTMTAMGHM